MNEGTETTETAMKQPENVAWKGDQPTEVVKKVFDSGIIKSGDKLLDIGCGFGRNANWLAAQGVNVTAVNINDAELFEAQQRATAAGIRVAYEHQDATDLSKYPDESFDVTMDLGCSHMLPDTDSQIKAARETARVVKPGGYLVFFGFTKDHPSYTNNPTSPQFRDLAEVEAMYGNSFEVVKTGEVRWKPLPEERASFAEHVGINVLMRRKTN